MAEGCVGALIALLKFEDVLDCVDVAHLNWFAEQYLEERKLEGEAKRKTYWALFYAWKKRALTVGDSDA